MLRNRLAKYGLTVEQYEALVKKQRGRCAICGTKPSRLVIDHCHNTLEVRGLLCVACNGAIGQLGDNEAGLLKALKYVQRVQIAVPTL